MSDLPDPGLDRRLLQPKEVIRVGDQYAVIEHGVRYWHTTKCAGKPCPEYDVGPYYRRCINATAPGAVERQFADGTTYSNPGMWVDSENRLWKGPSAPDENLHFARLEGFMDPDHGCEMIWVLRSSELPTGCKKLNYGPVPEQKRFKLWQDRHTGAWHATWESVHKEHRQAIELRDGDVDPDAARRVREHCEQIIASRPTPRPDTVLAGDILKIMKAKS